VAYVAGADPYEQDQLGGLKLTREDLRRRDRVVFETAASRQIPVTSFLAGGYAARVEDTVGIHADLVEGAFQAARA
jgi:acetoin utilization deacetylase AcuC-like enzyme